MKSLILITFLFSLVFLTNVTGANEFGNFQLGKVNTQSLCQQKQEFFTKKMMHFNIKDNSLRYFYAQQSTPVDTMRINTRTAPKIKKRSATAAFLIALVPGSVVHGAGHFYAGKPKTGFVLFGTEIVGIGLFMGGALSGLPGNVREDAGETIGFVGFSLFMFSWVYDIIVAPTEAKKHNQKPLEKTSLDLGILSLEGKQELKLLLSKRF